MYAGGLIGDASRAHVSDCSADVTVTGRCISGGFIGNVFWVPTKTVPPKAMYPEDGQLAGLPDVYLSPTPVWK